MNDIKKLKDIRDIRLKKIEAEKVRVAQDLKLRQKSLSDVFEETDILKKNLVDFENSLMDKLLNRNLSIIDLLIIFDELKDAEKKIEAHEDIIKKKQEELIFLQSKITDLNEKQIISKKKSDKVGFLLREIQKIDSFEREKKEEEVIDEVALINFLKI